MCIDDVLVRPLLAHMITTKCTTEISIYPAFMILHLFIERLIEWKCTIIIGPKQLHVQPATTAPKSTGQVA